MTISSPWEDEYWWLQQAAKREAEQNHAVGEEFGIPDPEKVARQVNEICATRLDRE